MFKNIPGHFGYTQLNNCKWLISFGQFKGLVRRGRKCLTLHRYPSKVEVLLHIHHGFCSTYIMGSYNICSPRLAYMALKISRGLFKSELSGSGSSALQIQILCNCSILETMSKSRSQASETRLEGRIKANTFNLCSCYIRGK